MSFDTPRSDNLTNSKKLFGGNFHFDRKEENSYSSNKIYIVAGERNIKAVNIHGGLYANVGQTTRRITDRLSDDDYKRKAGGGSWIPLLEYSVGNSISDKEIHIHLRQHPDVRWNRESNNTEEFLFCNDLGDGMVAKEIVLGILKKICLPMIQKENTLLLKKNEAITKELNEANEKIEEMLSEDYIQNLVSKVKVLELELTNKDVVLSDLSRIVKVREGTISNNEGRIASQERRLTEKSAAVSELEKKVNSAETNNFFMKGVAIFSLGAVVLGGCITLTSDKEVDVVSEQKEEIPAAVSATVTSPVSSGLESVEEAAIRKQFGLPAGQSAAPYLGMLSNETIVEIVKRNTPTTPSETLEKKPISCAALGSRSPSPLMEKRKKISCVSDEKIIVLSGEGIGSCSGLHVAFRYLDNDNSIIASCQSNWVGHISTVVTMK
jgi:hypothetical protein